MIVVESYRNMRKASNEQLVKVQADVSAFINAHENLMGGDQLTAMCLLKEAAEREQKRRAAQATVTPLAAKRAAS